MFIGLCTVQFVNVRDNKQRSLLIQQNRLPPRSRAFVSRLFRLFAFMLLCHSDMSEEERIAEQSNPKLIRRCSSDAYLRKRLVQSPTEQHDHSSQSIAETQTSKTSLRKYSFSPFYSSGRSSSVSSDRGSAISRCGSVFVEDPITGREVRKCRVLLLYTGGALGWKICAEGEMEKQCLTLARFISFIT